MPPNVICVFFPIIQSDKLRRVSFCDGGDKVYSCLETSIMEEKLMLAVSGHQELHAFTNSNYYVLNKTQQ